MSSVPGGIENPAGAFGEPPYLLPSGGGSAVVPLPSVGVESNVAAAVADTLLLAANPLRLGGTITNDGAANLFVALGFAASLTSWTVEMPPKAYYEIPYGFQGVVRGYWDVATGTARITELT